MFSGKFEKITFRWINSAIPLKYDRPQFAKLLKTRFEGNVRQSANINSTTAIRKSRLGCAKTDIKYTQQLFLKHENATENSRTQM